MSVRIPLAIAGSVALAIAAAVPAAMAAPGGTADSNPGTVHASEVAAFWTSERMAAAQPRDFVLDETGQAFLKTRQGLKPYGTGRGPALPEIQGPAAAASPEPMARPGGGGGGSTADTTGPTVTNRLPADAASGGSAVTFSATITDPSGVRSASLVLTSPGGGSQTFTMSASGSTYSASLTGFASGSTYGWYIVARDRASKTGNTTTTPSFSLLISGSGGGSGSTTVTNSRWITSGGVKNAAGRIYFQMGTSGYVCSGTAVTDTATSKSIIQTAAHCVYDDAAKKFATNVLFIPNQDQTTAASTDRNCSNDPIGCWAPTYGVVDTDWTTRTFPDNIPWDYGYYVVPTSGAYSSGLTTANSSLEVAAGTLDVSFTAPATGVYTHALGYSYSNDPFFMYCAENMTTNGAANWWLGSCGLSGGSSGGPWVQPMAGGTGPLVSVNSWGYTRGPGMAGPKLSGSSAQCLFTAAQGSSTPTAGGLIPSGC